MAKSAQETPARIKTIQEVSDLLPYDETFVPATVAAFERLKSRRPGYKGRKNRPNLARFAGLMGDFQSAAEAETLAKTVDSLYIFEDDAIKMPDGGLSAQAIEVIRLLMHIHCPVFIACPLAAQPALEASLQESGLTTEELDTLLLVEPPLLCSVRDALTLKDLHAQSLFYIGNRDTPDLLDALDEVPGRFHLNVDDTEDHLLYARTHALYKLFKRDPKQFKPSERDKVKKAFEEFERASNGDPFGLVEGN